MIDRDQCPICKLKGYVLQKDSDGTEDFRCNRSHTWRRPKQFKDVKGNAFKGIETFGYLKGMISLWKCPNCKDSKESGTDHGMEYLGSSEKAENREITFD